MRGWTMAANRWVAAFGCTIPRIARAFPISRRLREIASRASRRDRTSLPHVVTRPTKAPASRRSNGLLRLSSPTVGVLMSGPTPRGVRSVAARWADGAAPRAVAAVASMAVAGAGAVDDRPPHTANERISHALEP